MRKTIIALAAAVLLLPAPARVSAAGEYRVEFEGPDSLEGWGEVRRNAGRWELDLENRAYAHKREPDSGAVALSISPFTMTDGEIEIRAVATQHNTVNGGGCFGIMVKYIDARNWYAVRMSAYGEVNIRSNVDGTSGTIRTGYRWRPEIGRHYVAKVIVRGGRMMIMLDDEIIAAVEDVPLAGEEGHTGLYSLAASSYDYFSVARR